MLLRLENRFTKVLLADGDELSWLREFLSFKDKSFKPGRRGESFVPMLNEVNQTFPSGFIAVVQKRALEDGISLEVQDVRTGRVEHDPTFDPAWLRDFQREAFDVALRKERGIFWHATSAGKTELIVAIATAYPKANVLVLTNRTILCDEVAQRFEMRTGEEVGRIVEGKYAPARVTVATFQSLKAALSGMRAKKVQAFLDGINIAMTDEVHIAAADTYYRTLMLMPNAYRRYGFSGTPFARGDKKSVYVWASVGPAIHRVKAETLIEKGFSARPRVRMVPYLYAQRQPTWNDAYVKGIAENPERNALVAACAQTAKKPALLFVKAVEHGRALEKELTAQGVKCEFVWGKQATPFRKAAIRRLVHADVDVLICSVIFQEGVDIPELQSVINAQGGKSMIAVLQNLGRGMRRRTKSGEIVKDDFDVFDIADQGCGCENARPVIHKPCVWFSRHTHERLKAYALEKYDVIEDRSIVVPPRRRK